ncbi:MAG: hypothetical protein COA78_12115 [Blastopirellula sp.]|nr:MAG: hypothetical protein COA78_12115 [Blastopirellula sp.]
MSDLDLFDPQEPDMEIMTFQIDSNDDEIRDVIVALIKDAETCIPKDQELIFLFCSKPKQSAHDLLAQRAYVGWSYEPYPSPLKKMSVRHFLLNTYFQKLWKKPLPIEYKWNTNWIPR